MKKKFVMPTVQELLNKKIIYDEKKEPIWVLLEKEMQENLAVKPYNEKVGAWLHFLRDLKFFLYCLNKSKEKRLIREIGPSWYIEFSSSQRKVLTNLKHIIHQDILEDVTRRIRVALSDLGLTFKLSRKLLMNAMTNSEEDPGVFMWNLYKDVYNKSPSVLRSRYDMNAMILMSSLVFIDLDECIERLEKLTYSKQPPRMEKPPEIKKYFEPNVKYGVYLQKNYVPCYEKPKPKLAREPAPIGYKFHLKSADSLARLREDESFLSKRKERNIKEAVKERICTYKFWEAPICILRSKNKKKLALAVKMRMMKKKAKLKFISRYSNVQPLIGTVTYAGGVPNYVINNVALLPTGNILINSGISYRNGDFVTSISGFWKFPSDMIYKCDMDNKCNCLQWEEAVKSQLNKHKCECGHFVNFLHPWNKNPAKTTKYFKPANRFGEMAFDFSKIYQMDSTEDFIKKAVNSAVRSDASTRSTVSESTICATGLTSSELLATFLADLSNTPLIIPHLPEANLLNNLREWTRRRVKGNISPKENKRLMLNSQRRWLDLKHFDFRARAYRIPFTLKELQNLKWSYRSQIQRLFETLMNDFVSRNRLKMVEQSRMWWPTMKFDVYPCEHFLETYFTYMPSRMKDTFLINPYNSDSTDKSKSKTCPLNL